MDDTLTFRVLADGTVRIEAAGISGVNHASADALVKGIEALIGGKTDVTRRGYAHVHAHAHRHETEGQR